MIYETISPIGHLLEMFLPLNFQEYWTKHVTLGLLYVKFVFSIGMFYRGVPGFATDCPCGVWGRGLVNGLEN